MPDVDTAIRNTIRRLRFDHGEMTQQELADKIGVTRQTVNAIELGKYSPSLEVAFRIAAVFRVPLDQVFQYDGDGRRDPFVSLLNTSDLKPLLTDLKLVGVAYDPRGQNSVAVLRDVTSKDQYKVRVGQTIGRMRVAAIQPKAVIFTIEEFGYSRQELLPIAPPDSTKMRLRQ